MSGGIPAFAGMTRLTRHSGVDSRLRGNDGHWEADLMLFHTYGGNDERLCNGLPARELTVVQRSPKAGIQGREKHSSPQL